MRKTNIDDIYKVLLKYRFDLFRGEKGITQYIKEHCDRYYSDISTALNGENNFLGDQFVKLLGEKMSLLNEICREIPRILQLYDDGYIAEAYIAGEELFKRVEPEFLHGYAWEGRMSTYYRIREGNFQGKDKTELFHIKKTLRNRIGAYRYSLAGIPCLYLASGKELAWFECGMPKQFSYCQMQIDVKGEDAIRLVDFSRRPVEFLSSIRAHIWTVRTKDITKEKEVFDALIKYIVTYPLVAACSVKVKNRGNKFVEEYIFPQLFMQWVKKSSNIDGICYKSSLNTNLVDGMGAVNIALPVKELREDGIDKNLSEKIRISDIGYFDVNKEFEKYRQSLDELEKYKSGLYEYMIENQVAGTCILELINFCEYIIKMYNDLMEGNYTNHELMFNCLERMFDYKQLLYQSKNEIIQKCLNEKLAEDYNDKEGLEEIFLQFNAITNKILNKHTPFTFNFDILENYEKV